MHKYNFRLYTCLNKSEFTYVFSDGSFNYIVVPSIRNVINANYSRGEKESGSLANDSCRNFIT